MSIFETVSFHITKPCNAKCKFCYATFDDMHVKMMTLKDARVVINKLSNAGVKKVTFAGGEPLLFPYIQDIIIYAKRAGMTTSIITNGFLLTSSFLTNMIGWLDWIGLSVDSTDDATNIAIGRANKGVPMSRAAYLSICHQINARRFKLKINTVVCSLNKDEDLNSFLGIVKPARWKVFQALPVAGQNDEQFEAMKVSALEYGHFLRRHIDQPSLVLEDNRLMRGSYLLIDPQGRMFENSAGGHTYSDSLITHSVDHCLSQIKLNWDRFIERGGIYNW